MTNKRIMLLGSLTYAALLILAIIYYKERVIFTDVAYILFKIILEGDWAIQVNRYVSFFTQSFGLVASQLGLPLKWVAIIHSSGFIIYYYFLFIIILKVLKNPKLALGLTLYNILMVTMSFYWIPSELIQGGGFVFLYLALTDKIVNSKSLHLPHHLFSFGSLVTAIFAHPLLIFAVGYGLLYQKLHYRKKLKFYSIQLLLCVGIFLFKNKVFSNTYDSYAMSGLGNLKRFFTELDLSMFGDFFYHLIGDYILMSISGIVLLIYFVRSRQILKLFLFVGFFIGYSILVNIAQIGAKPQFYIESQYLILSIFVLLPLVTELMFAIKQQLSMTLLVSIITLSIFRIQQAHTPFTERLDWYRALLEKTSHFDNQKVLVNHVDLPMDILLEHWGSSYECWLLSTIETGKTRSVIFTNSESELADILGKERKKIFITKWNRVPYKWLNPRYFILQDTNHQYEKISLGQISFTSKQ